MTDFTSEFIPQLSGTDYMAYAIKTNHLLIEEGHADRDILAVNYDDSAFICLYGGEPVGILVFSITPWRKEVTIKLGRVQPEFRLHFGIVWWTTPEGKNAPVSEVL
jgi:hypothetical protein